MNADYRNRLNTGTIEQGRKAQQWVAVLHFGTWFAVPPQADAEWVECDGREEAAQVCQQYNAK